LPLAELQKFSPKIAQDVYQVLTLEGSLASRDHIGGTAPAQVKQAIARARKHLS
jgi:argininosuccinate lyase